MNVIKFVNKSKISREASRWIIRLDGQLPSEQEIRELTQWLDSSPYHRSEFIELANLWGSLDTLTALADLIPLHATNVAKQKSDSNKPLLGWVGYSPAMCASLILVALLGVFASLNVNWSDPLWYLSPDRAYSTGIGSSKNIELPDGSLIKLNTNSAIQVSYAGDARAITLQHGEAYFDVAKDPRRPFTVTVGNGKVTAIGTAFNIQFDDDFVDVIVTEGVVEVESPVPDTAPKGNVSSAISTKAIMVTRTALQANHAMRFDTTSAEIAELNPEQIDRELAWQRGMLIFEGHSLQEVVEEITRYTDTRIIIRDPEISTIRIGGYFKTGEIESMLEAFESSFGIRVTRLENKRIMLSRRLN